MLIFLTGPSSSGKTRLSHQCKKQFPFLTYLSSDEFYRDVETRLRQEWKHKLDWTNFTSIFQEKAHQEWVNRLNHQDNKFSVVLVDDIVQNIAGYLHEIAIPFRIYLIGIPLKQFYKNIKLRKDRKGGQVLKEIMEVYEPSPYPTKLIFYKKDLENFKTLSGYAGLTVSSNIKRAKQHFFSNGEEKVFVRNSIQVSLPVSSFVAGKNLFSKWKVILKPFIEKYKIGKLQK